MPQVPYTPYPTAEPTTFAGNDYLNVQANPADAGAQIGQAAQRVGNTLGQAGNMLAQHAVALQGMQNETMAADARNQMAQQMADANNDFQTLTGKAAVAAYPQFQAKIRQIYADGLNSMPSPQAKQFYAESASRYLDFHEGAASRWSAEQNRVWQKSSAVSSIQTQIDQGNIFGASDPLQRQRFENSVVQDTQNLGQLEGWDPATLKSNTAANLGRYYRPMIEKMAASDPGAAQKLLAQVAPKIDADSVAALTDRLKGAADQEAVANVANGILGSPPAVAPSSAAGPSGFANNVGNIRASNASFEGKGTPYNGFETFATPVLGVKAAVENLRSYAVQNGGSITLQDAITRWAPPNENDTRSYISAVSTASGLAPDAALPVDDPVKMAALVKAMATVEKGHAPFDDATFLQGAQAAIGAPAAGPAMSGTPSASAHSPESFTAEEMLMENARTEAAKQFPDRPDLQMAVVRRVQNQLAFTNSLQLKYEAEQQKAQHDAQEAAGNRIVTQLMTDPAHFDVSTIAHDPSLNYRQKENLWRLADSALAGMNSHDAQTYGPGFYSVTQAIHLPDGDPHKITSPSQLWSHVGPHGDLTVAGVWEATKELQSMQTPEGAAQAMMKKQFYRVAREQITGTNEGYGIRDPKGDEQFLKFIIAANAEYDKQRAAGKSAADLYSPTSKDYLGKIIPSFVRPMSQWTQDMLSANAPGAPVPGSAGATPDLSTLNGIMDAYHRGQLSRSDASAALVKGGFARAGAPSSTTPPTPALLGPH